MLAVTAIPGVMPGSPPHWWGAAISLVLIALGTGGIKSSVSAFVGDQFLAGQEHLLATVFALFYWIINIGSLLSTILTPILRTISFALAFGVPAALLLVATAVFFFGRDRFRKVPPGENVFKLTFQVIGSAFRGWRRRKSGASVADEKAPASFFDYAKAEVNHDSVEDVKSAFRVMVIYLPLPLFWALFDQHSTRWVLQAEEMDRNIFGWFTLLPELVQVLNTSILIWLIWIFDRLLYPLLARHGIILRPLKRMAIGMVFTALSFVVSGLVQVYIDQNPPKTVSVFLIIPQFFVVRTHQQCYRVLLSQNLTRALLF
jgi:dipeptide/tripeptide permease